MPATNRVDWIGGVESLFYAVHRRGDVVAALGERLAGMTRPLDVLDFGGGTGRVSAGLNRFLPGRYTVADVDGDSLAHVPAGLRAVVVPARGRLPFDDRSFDAILLVDVLHHVSDPLGTLVELARIARRGATILIVEFDARAWLSGVFARLSRMQRAGCTYMNPPALEILLARAGWKATASPLDALRFLAVGRLRPCPVMQPADAHEGS